MGSILAGFDFCENDFYYVFLDTDNNQYYQDECKHTHFINLLSNIHLVIFAEEKKKSPSSGLLFGENRKSSRH